MRLYVPLRRDEFDQLTALARVERRRPQDQAAVLIERALAANELASDSTAISIDTERVNAIMSSRSTNRGASYET